MTHEAKGHEIPLALGNTVATSSSYCTGATNSFQPAWKCRSVKLDGSRGHRGRCGGTPTYRACRAPGGSSTRTWGPLHRALVHTWRWG